MSDQCWRSCCTLSDGKMNNDRGLPWFFSGSPHLLTRLGLQSRFGDNLGQTTWDLTGVSPKRDWSSKRVKELHAAPENWLQQKTTSSRRRTPRRSSIQIYKTCHFSKEDWPSDDFRSRNHVIRKPYWRKYATSIVERVLRPTIVKMLGWRRLATAVQDMPFTTWARQPRHRVLFVCLFVCLFFFFSAVGVTSGDRVRSWVRGVGEPLLSTRGPKDRTTFYLWQAAHEAVPRHSHVAVFGSGHGGK